MTALPVCVSGATLTLQFHVSDVTLGVAYAGDGGQVVDGFFTSRFPMQAYLILLALVVGAGVAGWGSRALATRVVGRSPELLFLIVADVAVVIWAWTTVPLPLVLPITCGLGWTLVALAACDAVAYRLPDVLTLPLIVAGLALSWFLPSGDLIGHIIGAVAGFAVFALIALVYEKLRKREGLGLGDAKLVAAAGAWLGWQALPSVILVGALGGLVWVLLRFAVRGRASLAERIPFGVPLCAAFWLAWLYGPLIPY